MRDPGRDECPRYFAAAEDPSAFVLDLTHEIENDLGHGLSFTMARRLRPDGAGARARALDLSLLRRADDDPPVPRIDDSAWRWHIGLDVEASGLLNELYRGEAPAAEQLQRLVGLFRLDFADPLDDARRRRRQAGLSRPRDERRQVLKLKPQNLLVDLPLATRCSPDRRGRIAAMSTRR